MPDTCAACRCRLTGEAPATLTDLAALTKVSPLGHDVETLCLLGTTFEDALITTRNGSALIAGRGGMGPVQTSQMPFRVSARRVTMRTSASSPLHVCRSAPDPNFGLPGALVAADPDGTIFHRIQVSEPFDQMIAESLDPVPGRPNAPPDAPLAGVIPLTSIRNARAHWGDCDIGNHLNDLLQSCGIARRQCLPHVGKGRAWQVVPHYLPSFLSYLARRNRRLVKIVVAPGLIQADVGTFDHLTETDGLILATYDGGAFSIDLATIESTWVTASRNVWQLEFYNGAGQAVASLTGAPDSDLSHWRDLLASLPRMTA